MIKFIIFVGNHDASEGMADIKANEWIEKHPNISIIDMKYQQARYGDHSICIMYEEESKGGKW